MKSSFCNTGTCVDVEQLADGDICVSDKMGNHSYFTRDEWEAFAKGVKNHEFDIEKLEAAANG